MTDKQPMQQLMQETENSIEAATKALEQAAISAKELKEIMESRIPKVIKWVFESASSPQSAVKDLLGMGYTKKEIRDCGYGVD